MQPNKAYDEVIEFIAASSPENVIAFRPSDEVKTRVADLIFREKTEGLPDEATLKEKSNKRNKRRAVGTDVNRL